MQRTGKRFDRANEAVPLKACTLLNLSVKKQLSADWQWLARVDNLTNRDYETAKDYATGGRQFYVGLRWQPAQ